MIEWIEIPGYEDEYKVSIHGQFKSLKWGKERILKQRKHHQGYFEVKLCKNGVERIHKAHRLIAQAFIPNPNNLPKVLHRDDNPSNNHVDNLFWGTQADNMRDMASKNRQGKPKRPVVAITPDGLVVYEYESEKEAQRQTGVRQGNISNCCNGKCKSAGGLKWSYL